MVTQTQSLTETASTTIGKMIVEGLSGNITDATLEALRDLPKEDLPEPFAHLAKVIGGSADTDRLAHTLVDELHIICEDMLGL